MGIAEAVRRSFEEIPIDVAGGWRAALPDDWIDEALKATGTSTLRRRRLPAKQVLWLVLGMALMRERSLQDIVRALDIALPGQSAVVPSAITQARARLGTAPVKSLFTRTGVAWTDAHADTMKWRGLALYGVDGTTMDVPDTPENRAHFVGQNGPVGPSPYPMLRMVVLAQLRTHLLRSAAVGAYTTGEQTLALQLRDDIPDRSLTIVDRNFFSANFLYSLAATGVERHWLRRAREASSWEVAYSLGTNDDIVISKISDRARGHDPELPGEWMMRAITYKRGGKKHVLLTSLLDDLRYPAAELVSLYYERWEVEMTYDELKTDLNHAREVLRSRSPAGVEQEIWGSLLAYNLVRLEIARVAAKAKTEPTRISFVGALRLIRDEWLWSVVTSPGAIPGRLLDLEQNLLQLVLPPRRKQRKYPRALKNVSRGYPRKPRIGSAN